MHTAEHPDIQSAERTGYGPHDQAKGIRELRDAETPEDYLAATRERNREARYQSELLVTPMLASTRRRIEAAAYQPEHIALGIANADDARSRGDRESEVRILRATLASVSQTLGEVAQHVKRSRRLAGYDD